MRSYIYLVTLVLAVLLGTTCCKKLPKESVKISIDFPEAAGDTFILGRANLISLAGIELASVTLDSAGKGVLTATVKEPVYAYINNGKNVGAGILATGPKCAC